jgi:sensor histidine kinase YesM
VLTPPVFYLVRRYPITSGNRVRRIALYVMGTIPFMLLYAFIRWCLLPAWNDVTSTWDPRNSHVLIELLEGSFATQIWDYIAIVIAAHAYHYFMRSRDQEIESFELQQALAQSELQALKSQLHPHFLFNTLHDISSLIDTDRVGAKSMIVKLSGLLRTALKYGSSDLIPLEEELDFVKAYLDLEKMRLGSRLATRWSIAPDTYQVLIPQLVLQPLVENAIIHGISCCREGGWIEITSTKKDGILHLEVRNSVGGKSQAGLGLGLSNTRSRLQYLYSGEATFSFELATDRTASVRLTLPAFGLLTSPPGKHKELKDSATTPRKEGKTYAHTDY